MKVAEPDSSPANWLATMDIERASACITWMFVSGSALYFLSNHYTFMHWRTLTAAVIFIALAVSFVIVSRHEHDLPALRMPTLCVMYLLALASQLVVPYVYLAIFVVIWSAMLPYYLSWKTCIALSIPLAFPTVFIQSWVWHENQALLTGALFWTFNLFAMIMSNTAIKEAKAREEADALNRQLLSTQQLMKQALTQDERLRIARNIHDVLGHHLTALTINLQVASRKAGLLNDSESQGIKQHVDRSHGIAKLLLSDVREAISDIRENAAIDFNLAVNALIKDLPRPHVDLHIDKNLSLTNVRIADCLLRSMQEALTNVIRHTQSPYFLMVLAQREGKYYLLLQDSNVRQNEGANKSLNHIIEHAKVQQTNVDSSNPVVAGNGLQGMTERVNELNGTIHWKRSAEGFCIEIEIPEGE